MLEGFEVDISNNPLALRPTNIQVCGYYGSLYDGKCCIGISQIVMRKMKNIKYAVCDSLGLCSCRQLAYLVKVLKF